jgi:hypothetical protein
MKPWVRLACSTLLAGSLALGQPLQAAPQPGGWVEALQPAVAPVQPGAIALPTAGAAANPEPEGWAQQQPGQPCRRRCRGCGS